MLTISVIIPAYNEAANIPVLCERLSAVAATMPGYRLEFLFVDDGSKDATPETVAKLHLRDSRVKGVRFSRNFGSHAAGLAGLMEAKGDVMVILAADLQDPPELLPDMLAKIEQGFDVVAAVRNQRDDSWLTVRLANTYHRLMRRYAIPNWPVHGADVFMFTRQVAETVIRWRQKNTSIFAQLVWVGFRQASVPYIRDRRQSGRSKWTFARKVKLLIDSFVSFSFSPLRAISYSGMVFSALGLAYAAFIVAKKLVYGVPVQGWASLMVVLLVVSGFQLLMLGVIGEYLWRVADEVRGAPSFVIHSRLGMNDPDGAVADQWVRDMAQSRGEEPEESTLERRLR
jgi:polyisoprenyl-phosphate glycosyltransferase